MTREELEQKIYNYITSYSDIDVGRYNKLVEESDIQIGMIVEWNTDCENETMLPFYEKNHWQRIEIEGVQVEVINIILDRFKTKLCYILQDSKGKRYYVRRAGIKLNEFQKIINEINQELNLKQKKK